MCCICPNGEMVDTTDLRSVAERRVGSSPSLGTILCSSSKKISNINIYMKICKICKIKKESNLFTKDCSSTDGLYCYCKECKQKRDRISYKTKQTVKVKHRSKRHRDKNMKTINNIKMLSGCVSCGEKSHPALLEFHHPDPTKKDFAIGSNRSLSLISLTAEIKKCICVCANCHRKIHVGLIDGSILPLINLEKSKQ